MWQLPFEWLKGHDSRQSLEEHKRDDGVKQEDNLPKVHVKHMIMKYAQNSAVGVQRINPETTAKTASPSIATDTDVRNDQTDHVMAKYSQKAAACVSPRNAKSTSKTASNIATTGKTDVLELCRTRQQAISDNLEMIGTNSSSRHLDGTKSWRDPGNTASLKRRIKLFQVDDERQTVMSEGQTPVSTDDRCRVSRTSSLDQLRLRFQHQRRNVGRFRAELDHLKKKVIDAQHELDKERNGRRQLEEWTEYVESQLKTYMTSRSLVEKRYAVFFTSSCFGHKDAGDYYPSINLRTLSKMTKI